MFKYSGLSCTVMLCGQHNRLLPLLYTQQNIVIFFYLIQVLFVPPL